MLNEHWLNRNTVNVPLIIAHAKIAKFKSRFSTLWSYRLQLFHEWTKKITKSKRKITELVTSTHTQCWGERNFEKINRKNGWRKQIFIAKQLLILRVLRTILRYWMPNVNMYTAERRKALFLSFFLNSLFFALLRSSFAVYHTR